MNAHKTNKKGSSSDSVFYAERDAAVYEAYKLVLRETPKDAPFNINDALTKLQAHRQRRFWVQPRTIYNILRKYRSGAYDTNPAHLKPLIRDVIRAYLRIRNKREFQGKSLYFIADFVTAEPAKGFYLSKRRLADIIRQQKRLAFQRRCSAALTGLQSYERHALLYGYSPISSTP